MAQDAHTQDLGGRGDHPHGSSDGATAARQRWMAVLAKAEPAELEAAWKGLADKPDHTFMRPAEPGLVMVRGRAGGAGARFNLGEMSVTRCVVRLADGAMGFGYVAGIRRRQAELAALFDALLQDPARRAELESAVVAPLEAAHHRRRDARSRKARATTVDFYTLVRGDNPS
ncbi:MAG: phosphonate C-P lyase system protein PhnG [Inquilinaceae bacterium]